MIDFRYSRATDAAAAIKAAGDSPSARYLGGGTNLVDLMREEIERPEAVIDISGLHNRIDERDDGGLVVGAGVRNTSLAEHRGVRERYPVLAQAILNGASPQIRNMATVGGNILQRTRCYYFYDKAARCNKRARGTGCDAVDGFNRLHAILGASPHCVATHPSDMCVALVALDAGVRLEGAAGRRTVPLRGVHLLPGDTPDVETTLRPGELITAIEIPSLPFARRSLYRKVRDRASFAFALVSVAAILDLDHRGNIREARLALGGVAHKPWRATAAEAVLQGAPAEAETFARAADAELRSAVGLAHNGFKVELVKRVVVSVLQSLTAMEGVRP